MKAIPATRQPNPTRQHTRNGPGKPLKVYKVGVGGGFYAGQPVAASASAVGRLPRQAAPRASPGATTSSLMRSGSSQKTA